MTLFLQRIKSLFRRTQAVEDAAIDEILQRHFQRLRNVDAETHEQRLRLQRTIAYSETKARSAKYRLVPRLALSSAIVALALIVAYLYFTPTTTPPQTFATGKGERKELVLIDGSQVILNHTTKLVVPDLQVGEPRRLALNGEAFFRVQGNGTPFIVSTTFADVHVIGTEFNVRAREGSLEVAVIQGIVRVGVVRDGKDSLLQLSQHQVALCPQNGFPGRAGDISSMEYPGWMHGKLFLSGSSFLAACREIELRFDVEISISDKKVGDEVVTGILDAKTAQSALTALCELTGKKFTHDGQAYHIY